MEKDVSKKNTIFEIEPKIELLQRIMLYEAKKMFHKENTSHMWKFTEIKRIWKGAEKILIDDVQLKLILEII